MDELTQERYEQLLKELETPLGECEGDDILILEMDLKTAGIKLEGQEDIQKAMQIIMNLLIKQPIMYDKCYLQTTSFVSYKVNGKIYSYPLYMASGIYDRKKLISNNIIMVRKGNGIKHLLAHIWNIRKLKDKNFRNGVDRNKRPVITSKVAFDCYEKALQELQCKLEHVLEPDGKNIIFEYNSQKRVSNVIMIIPINYGGEIIEFKFVIDIPAQGSNDISTIVSGYPKQDSSLNLKSHKK